MLYPRQRQSRKLFHHALLDAAVASEQPFQKDTTSIAMRKRTFDFCLSQGVSASVCSALLEDKSPTTTTQVPWYSAAFAEQFSNGILVCHEPSEQLLHFPPGDRARGYPPEEFRALLAQNCYMFVAMYVPLSATGVDPLGHFAAIVQDPFRRSAPTTSIEIVASSEADPTSVAEATLPEMNGGAQAHPARQRAG